MRHITYDLQDGNLPEGTKLVTEWDMRATRALPTPIRGEDKFIGWFNEDGKRIEALLPIHVYDGMILKAVFEEAPKSKKPKSTRAKAEGEQSEIEIETV